MSWITLTADDLRGSMTSSEATRFGTADATTPADRVTPILDDLVSEIRGQIATCKQNVLDEDETLIPRSMRANALAIARYRLLITIPGYTPGESRTKEYENAVKYFAQVAMCKIRPEAPDNPIANTVPEETHQPGVEIVTSAPSRTGRVRMNGL